MGVKTWVTGTIFSKLRKTMPFLNKIMTDQTIKIFKKWAYDQKGAVLLVRAKVSKYIHFHQIVLFAADNNKVMKRVRGKE